MKEIYKRNQEKITVRIQGIYFDKYDVLGLLSFDYTIYPRFDTVLRLHPQKHHAVEVTKLKWSLE